RLDIFGTPPRQRSNYISYEDDSDEEENPDLDISHFLVEPKNSKNPFAADDDSEDMPSTHNSFDTETKERSTGEGFDSIYDHNQDMLITRKPFDDESKIRDIDGDLEFTRNNNFEDTPNTYSLLEDERKTKDKTNAFEFSRDYSPDHISRTHNSLNDERKQRDIGDGFEFSREYNINDIPGHHNPLDQKSEMRNMVRETKDYLELEHNSESERSIFETREKEIEEQYEGDVDMDVDSREEYSNDPSHLPVTRHQLPLEDDLDMQTTQEFERDDLDMQMTQEFKKDDSNMQITQESEKDDLDMQMTQEFKEDVLDMQMTQEFKEDELDMQITQEFKKDDSNMQITQESEKVDLDIQEHAYNKTQISSKDMSMQFTQEIAVLKRPSVGEENMYTPLLRYSNSPDTTISIVQPSSEHKIQLRQQLPHLLGHQKNINDVLGKAREKERKQYGFDHIKLVKAQTEIEHQQRSIESLGLELNELEEKNSKTHEKIKKLEIYETQLRQQIFQTKQEIEDNKKVTEEDLKAVQKKHSISCTIRGWELLREDENTLEIMVGEDLKMKIDREGLQNKKPDALSFQISHKKEKELGHLIALKRGLDTLSSNETDLNKVVRRAVTYWNKLELIVDMIKDSRLHFRVQIDPLEAVEDVDSGIQYLISASNIKKETSIVVNFNIRIKDMRKFPYMDMSSIDVNVNHGHIIDAKNRFQNLMKNNGVLDIVDSVNSLFE
ncbi:hypothetical protein CU098_000351, partial [Rhizopus stolonifer]